jgi:hypothetical protein
VVLPPCRLLYIKILSRKGAQLTTSCYSTRDHRRRKNASLRQIGTDNLVGYFIKHSFQEKEYDSPLLVSRPVCVSISVEIIVLATVETVKIGVRRY